MNGDVLGMSTKSSAEEMARCLVTVEEFAKLARLSRRQIDRLRVSRPSGFPREYELGTSPGRFRRSPRFKLVEVMSWIDSRALW